MRKLLFTAAVLAFASSTAIAQEAPRHESFDSGGGCSCAGSDGNSWIFVEPAPAHRRRHHRQARPLSVLSVGALAVRPPSVRANKPHHPPALSSRTLALEDRVGLNRTAIGGAGRHSSPKGIGLAKDRPPEPVWGADPFEHWGLPGQFRAPPLQLRRGLDRLDALVSRSNGLTERSLEALIGVDQPRVLLRRGNRRL